MLSVALFAAMAQTQNLKVYHLNPISAGVVPVNMDTGDAQGDLYFYLGQFLLPLECANVSNSSHHSSGFDCHNPERRDKSLVVTEVDLTIKADAYTTYSACNLCNGTDPFTHEPCTLGTYVCDCFHHGGNSSGGNITCDNTKIGYENVTEQFTHQTSPKCEAALKELCPVAPGSRDEDGCNSCTRKHEFELYYKYGCSKYDFYYYCPSNEPDTCEPWNADWNCWRENIVRKTGGLWYSTMAEGQCTGKNDGNCSWTVENTKTVNETCMHESIVDIVEDYSPDCFQDCTQPRNESSACWIGCFFDAILGPQARNSSTVALGGMPLSKLEEGWTRAFNGRCPLITAP